MTIIIGQKPGSGGEGGGLSPAQETKLNNIQDEATKNLPDATLLARENHTGTQGMATVEGLDAALDTKVDKVAGKGLSDTSYTQAEKDKLAGLESSRFKGQYASLAALQAAHPTAAAGDYASVDEGVGHDVVRYVWDTSDAAWIQQLGSSSQLTGAQIKQEYEAQPDTNAFSDAEKQKLSTVAENANNYQHPADHPATMIQQDANHRFVTDAEKTDWNSKETPTGAQQKVVDHADADAAHPASKISFANAGTGIEANRVQPAIITALDFANFSTMKKRLPLVPAWQQSGTSMATAQEIAVRVGAHHYKFAQDALITLPTLTPGTDYAVYATADGRLVADVNFSAPTGEPAGTTVRVGGFHVFLTGEIAPYSLWDERFRPECSDPRGMVLVAGREWADIYLLGINHHTDGTSKANVTIADGSSPPKIPIAYGGNGSTAYTRFGWFEARDIMAAYGKTLFDMNDFPEAARGSALGTSVGTDPVTTGHSAGYRSAWGLEQATGCMWQWARNISAWNASGAWVDMGTGRGNWYGENFRAARLGAYWGAGASSGPDAVNWINSPTVSSSNVGARGRCGHLILT